MLHHTLYVHLYLINITTRSNNQQFGISEITVCVFKFIKLIPIFPMRAQNFLTVCLFHTYSLAPVISIIMVKFDQIWARKWPLVSVRLRNFVKIAVHNWRLLSRHNPILLIRNVHSPGVNWINEFIGEILH